MYFDSHVHFRETEGPAGSLALIDRAVAAGVTRMVAVGGDCDLNKQAVDAMRRFPEHVLAAIGFDRDEAQRLVERPGELDNAMDRTRFTVEQLRETGSGISAIGETGLDFHYSADTADLQDALFRRQLALAAELRLPVIIHSREADERTLLALGEHAAAWTGAAGTIGVLHCFTGGLDFARALIDLGYYISFSGILSFPNAESLRAVARQLPLDRVLVETDTPYLAPVPHRGKKNEPAFVADVAACLAATRGEHAEDVARVTSENAEALFGRDATA